MGRPHLRCLEMHQSARPSVMFLMRVSPLAGTHCTPLMAARACSRNPTTDANHCSMINTIIIIIIIIIIIMIMIMIMIMIK